MTSQTQIVRASKSAPAAARRLVAGALVFGLAQLAPLLIPLIVAMDLSAGWKTALSTVLLLGVPEAGILLSVAILGKEGFAWLKAKIFSVLKRALPPDHVGPMRHRMGVALFAIPLILGWLLPYLEPLSDTVAAVRLELSIAGDSMLIISLFVLGGDFWDKLRGLFLRRAVIANLE